MKVTSATILIALLIGCFLYPVLWKSRKAIFTAAITCMVGMLCFNAYCKTLPYQQDFERLKAPVTYWFAIGLGPNGTYSGSEEFALRCLTTENEEERKEIVNQQIAENIHNLWNLDHIIAKARQNFGCGDLGAAGYLLYPYEENILWHWFSQDGDYYWKYACLTTSFFFSVLFYLGVGGALQLCKKPQIYKQTQVGEVDRASLSEIGFFLSALSFWGLCLFLMLWEAQDKQMYNHSGWLILGLVFCLNIIGENVQRKRKE